MEKKEAVVSYLSIVEKDSFIYKGYANIMDGDTTLVSTIPLKDFLEFKKIDKKEYEQHLQEYQNNFVQGNHNVLVDEKGVKIFCGKNRTIQLKNRNGENDSWDEMQYIYQTTYTPFNWAIVHGSGYESGSYELVDLDNCETVGSTHGTPSISKKDKKVISIQGITETYADESIISIHGLKEGKLQLTTNIHFNYSVNENEEIGENTLPLIIGENGNIFIYTNFWNVEKQNRESLFFALKIK